MDCPDDNAILGYVERLLPPQQRTALTQHFGECAACRRLLVDVSGQPSPSEAGRYELLTPLGAGGMGVVHSAFDRELGRRVALKFLGTEPGEDLAAARARLQREAQSLARLSHPNVITVHDVGVLEGEVFIAMEQVEGATLRAWLDTRRALPEILGVMRQAGEGLAAAHAAGLVHRDFKPDNVLVGNDGRVRVTDFGLARDHELAAPERTDSRDSAGTASITRTGVRAGTPAYMSPEQKQGLRAGVASDIYSYCRTLQEAATGVAPGGVGVPRARMPNWLDRAISRGLAEVPEHRWLSMRELLRALDRGRRRPTAALAAGGVLTLAGLLAAGVAVHQRRSDVCFEPVRRLAGIWDPVVAAQVRDHVIQQGGPEGVSPWVYLQGALDRSAQAWVTSYRDACRLTRDEHQQSETELRLRLDCLERQRLDIRAIVEFVGRPGSLVSQEPAGVATALPLKGECDDARSLSVIEPPPAGHAAEVAVCVEKLAEARVLSGVGRTDEAIATLHGLAETARRLNDLPLQAEVAFELAGAQAAVPDYRSMTITNAQSLELAERAHMDSIAARSATRQLFISAQLASEPAQLAVLSERARLLASRAEDNEVVQADLHDALAMEALVRGDVRSDIEQEKEALEHAEKGYGPERTEAMAAASNLAFAYDQAGQYDQELVILTELTHRVRQLFGSHGNPMGVVWINLAQVLIDLDRRQEASAVVEDGLKLMAAASNSHSAALRVEQSVLMARAGDAANARSSSRRALEDGTLLVGQDRADLLRDVVEVETRLDHPEEAATHFGEILSIEASLLPEKSARWVPYLMVGGRALLHAGQTAKAIEVLSRAQGLLSQHPFPAGWTAAIDGDLAASLMRSRTDLAPCRRLVEQGREALGATAQWPDERRALAQLDAALGAAEAPAPRVRQWSPAH